MPETRDFRTLRQRYADAVVGVLDDWARNPGDEGQFVGRMVHAVKAVRDEELERLRHMSNTDSRITLQLREEITRLRINAEKDVCSGCMQREEARDRAMESARQTGVKYEGAKQRWYEQQDRAEDAERERDEWRERAETAGAAIARVREAHARDDSNPHGPWCDTCMATWPCQTVAALDDQEANRD